MKTYSLEITSIFTSAVVVKSPYSSLGLLHPLEVLKKG
jgi:hypothetical protein